MPTDEESEQARASRNLVNVASTTKEDLYALLSLDSSNFGGINAASLKKAWRTTALKWHPDKNRGNEKIAADKYDEARKAFDILSDPSARAAYDDKQRAAREKKERDAAFEGKRRKMKEDLERRESGSWSIGSPSFGVKRMSEESPEDQREAKVRRLAADGARRLREREEQMRRERQDANRKQEEDDIEDPFVNTSEPKSTNGATTQTAYSSILTEPSELSEMGRTIKIRWPREGAGLNIDRDTLARLFSRFGTIESTLLLKDKKSRPSMGTSLSGSPTDERRVKKQTMATGIVIFTSILSAHTAVVDSTTISQLPDADPEWSVLDSVTWASSKQDPTVTDFESTMMRLRETARRVEEIQMRFHPQSLGD